VTLVDPVQFGSQVYGQVSRVPACLAGVMVGCIYLCCAAGDPIWQVMFHSPKIGFLRRAILLNQFNY